MNRKKIYSLSFCLPIIIMGFVFFIMKLYPFSDATINSGDFKNQYLPLYVGLKDLIISGNWKGLFWSFSKSLGGTMPSVWGFNSISPFTLLYVFFPVKDFSLATVIITLLRYAFAALTFSYFLVKRYYKINSEWLVITLSIAYSMCGFMVAHQINPNFLDNIVYLPLIMIGVEEILDGQWNIKYSFLLAIIMITQFYTGYMICLFIVLYGIAYLISQDYPLTDKFSSYLRLAVLSILGGLLASFWLLPVMNALIESKASATETFELGFKWLYDVKLLLSKFMIGSFDSAEWGSSTARPQLFIGSLGILGGIHYFLNDKITIRKKIGSLFLLIVIFFSVSNEFGDKIWHMGQRPVGFYFRNSWIFSFYFLKLSYESLSTQFKVSWQKWLVFPILIFLTYILLKDESITYLETWQLYLSLGLWFCISMFFIKGDSWKAVYPILLVITIIEMGGNAYIGQSRNAYFISNESLSEMLDNYQIMPNRLLKETENNFYRAEINKRPILANEPLVDKYHGVSHFTSSLEYALIDNLAKFGLPTSTAFTNYTSRTPLTDALFNVNYFVDKKGEETNQPDLTYTHKVIKSFDETRDIYKSNYALSLGFLVTQDFNQSTIKNENPAEVQNQVLDNLFEEKDNFFELSSFSKISINNLSVDNNIFNVIDPSKERSLTFHVNPEPGYLYYLRVPEEFIPIIKKSALKLNDQPYFFADRYTTDQLWSIGPKKGLNNELLFNITSNEIESMDIHKIELYKFDIDRFQKLLADKQEDNLIIDDWSDNHINAHVSVNNDKLKSVFTSIPFNSGWKVKIDGKKVNTYKVWDTFIGFDISKGNHTIEMKYNPPGLLLGSVLSIGSLICLITIQYKQKNNKKDTLLK